MQTIIEMKEKHKVTLITPRKGDNQITARKTGRNEPCPCGSGKKAKRCCGAETKYYSNKTK